MRKISINNWVLEDQPLYKLLEKGKFGLTDAELLCIIVAGRSCNDIIRELVQKILKAMDYSLDNLARAGVKELIDLGLTQQKAIILLTAFEIGKRRTEAGVVKGNKISSSKDAFAMFCTEMGDSPYEQFWIIMLNRANRIIKKTLVGEGGVSGTVVDPKKIFKIALDNYASSIILGHNHPSGNIQPSEADLKITKTIRDAGLMLDIAVLDHIIVTQDAYYSFADENNL